MRGIYREILKAHFQNTLKGSKMTLGVTQAKMAEMLEMDERSYIDLVHGRSCCSATTLALYLVYICKDVLGFVEELRCAFEKGKDQAA